MPKKARKSRETVSTWRNVSAVSRPIISAPRFAKLRLSDLEIGNPDQLVADGSVEGERFENVDLSGQPLGGLHVSECEMLGLNVGDADLRNVTFAESRVRQLNAPVLRASCSNWRDVVIEQSRIGSAELYDSSWRGVQFIGCKLGYLNLRGANLRDVSFVDCQIDELDLGGATATRMLVSGTTVRTLSLVKPQLQHVDLREAQLEVINGIEGLAGTTLSSIQVAQLAPVFAARLGITVAE